MIGTSLKDGKPPTINLKAGTPRQGGPPEKHSIPWTWGTLQTNSKKITGLEAIINLKEGDSAVITVQEKGVVALIPFLK